MIARVTEWCGAEGREYCLGEVRWAHVSKSMFSAGRYDVDEGDMIIGNRDCSFLRHADGDKFRIVPEDKLPNYVLTKLARMALTGEISDA